MLMLLINPTLLGAQMFTIQMICKNVCLKNIFCLHNFLTFVTYSFFQIQFEMVASKSQNKEEILPNIIKYIKNKFKFKLNMMLLYSYLFVWFFFPLNISLWTCRNLNSYTIRTKLKTCNAFSFKIRNFYTCIIIVKQVTWFLRRLLSIQIKF